MYAYNDVNSIWLLIHFVITCKEIFLLLNNKEHELLTHTTKCDNFFLPFHFFSTKIYFNFVDWVLFINDVALLKIDFDTLGNLNF